MSAPVPKILAIVPAYNEAGNIGSVVQQIRSLSIPVDVLVVNDGSRDSTAQEASAQGASVVSLPFNLGIGGAVQTGFQFAFDGGYDIAVQIDGDGQHDAADLPKLLAPITAGHADMVVGSRFMENSDGFKSSFSRRLGIQFFVHLIGALTGASISDPTSGFRAYNQKMIRLFAEQYPHDFPEPEAIMLARLFEAKIEEVPVEMRKRSAGLSSIRYMKTLYYMVKVTFAILLNKIKKKKEIN